MTLFLAYTAGLLLGYASGFDLHGGTRGAVVYWIGIALFVAACWIQRGREDA